MSKLRTKPHPHGTYYLNGQRVWYAGRHGQRVVVSHEPPSYEWEPTKFGGLRLKRVFGKTSRVSPKLLSRDRKWSKRLARRAEL